MKKTILLSIIALLAFTTFGQNKGKVTVAVAANMQYAMNALKDKFEKIFTSPKQKMEVFIVMNKYFSTHFACVVNDFKIIF